MRGTVQLAAIAVAALCAGCTSIVNVSYGETEDFSAYRSWDWLPGGRNVDALPGEDHALDALTSRFIEEAFRERGLVRVHEQPDFLIGYQLRVSRQIVVVNETGASRFLSSLHDSPSFTVQITTSRIEIYDSAFLRFRLTDGQDAKMLWRAELSTRHRGDFADHLSESVSRLMAEFPVGKAAAELAVPAASRETQRISSDNVDAP